jgi:hypothetical protein
MLEKPDANGQGAYKDQPPKHKNTKKGQQTRIYDFACSSALFTFCTISPLTTLVGYVILQIPTRLVNS